MKQLNHRVILFYANCIFEVDRYFFFSAWKSIFVFCGLLKISDKKVLAICHVADYFKRWIQQRIEQIDRKEMFPLLLA